MNILFGILTFFLFFFKVFFDKYVIALFDKVKISAYLYLTCFFSKVASKLDLAEYHSIFQKKNHHLLKNSKTMCVILFFFRDSIKINIIDKTYKIVSEINFFILRRVKITPCSFLVIGITKKKSIRFIVIF